MYSNKLRSYSTTVIIVRGREGPNKTAGSTCVGIKWRCFDSEFQPRKSIISNDWHSEFSVNSNHRPFTTPSGKSSTPNKKHIPKKAHKKTAVIFWDPFARSGRDSTATQRPQQIFFAKRPVPRFRQIVTWRPRTRDKEHKEFYVANFFKKCRYVNTVYQISNCALWLHLQLRIVHANLIGTWGSIVGVKTSHARQ